MLLEKIPFSETHSFSKLFLDYINQSDGLAPFYNRFPNIANFKKQIEEKNKSYNQKHRTVLSKVLKSQYSNIEISNRVKENLGNLENKSSYTITTGHQLNIFTGPLYFIYKIISVINTCKQLQKAYPKYNFIPVYWMASEDHDFEEINHFRLDGKKYSWDSNQKGGVGRFDPTELKNLLDEIPGDTKIFKEAYLNHSTLSDAVRYYVNALFGEEGLIVIDSDDRAFKKLFDSIITDDLFEHSSKKNVDATNDKLEKLGYHVQVHARDINLFYLDHQLRSRIEKEGPGYQVVDHSIKFSVDQVKKLIANEPEKFSPNVILRPIYQEFLLPNLAYIGGPAEVVYWLQLKTAFDHLNITYPVVMPRNFGLVLNKPLLRKFQKTKLTVRDLFLQKEDLLKQWTIANAQHELSTSSEIEVTNALYQKLLERATQLDPTLDPLVKAENQKIKNSLEKIERKMIKSEKKFQQDKLRQIEAIKDGLFPNGSPQERVENFLMFYQLNKNFLQMLLSDFDPFDFQMNVMSTP